ncbi:hypothetical protein ILYODFUR_011401, partial [Ilyodon furcidens]
WCGDKVTCWKVNRQVSEWIMMVRSPSSKFQEGSWRSVQEICDRSLGETFPTGAGNEEAGHWSPSTEHGKVPVIERQQVRLHKLQRRRLYLPVTSWNERRRRGTQTPTCTHF